MFCAYLEVYFVGFKFNQRLAGLYPIAFGFEPLTHGGL
jgi:hypothetical protein